MRWMDEVKVNGKKEIRHGFGCNEKLEKFDFIKSIHCQSIEGNTFYYSECEFTSKWHQWGGRLMRRATLFSSSEQKQFFFFTKIVLSNRQFHSDANNLKDRLFSLDLEFRRAGISFILIENYHLKQTANTHFLDCCTVLSIAIPFSIAALHFLLYLKNKQLHTNFCESASTMLKLAKLSRQ